jgi:predicted permease
MGWRDAARISDVAFTELSLQAIYAFRQGNLFAGPAGPDLVRRARRRVVQSKILVALVLLLLTGGAAVLLRLAPTITAHPFFGVLVSGPVFDVGVLTALLCLDLAFLWWTGLQVLPTFLASGVLPVLEPLPIDPVTLGRAAGLLYLRLFDVPALAILVATPLFVGAAIGPAAGVAVVPGVAAGIVFALALALVTGRAFARRVQGSRGGGGRTVVRWAYLVLWVLPAFAMFGLVVAAPGLLAILARTIRAGPSVAADLLLAAFPITFAALPSVVGPSSGGLPVGLAGTSVLVAALAGYLLLAAGTVRWLMGAVRRVGLAPPTAARAMAAGSFELRPHRPALAVLTKDLRIASRTPGYAFLVLFPALDAVAIGLFTFVTGPGTNGALALALAAVTTAALLATFFGPAFFAIEVNAYAYARTLPLPDRSVIAGKVGLVSGIYLLASGLVLGLTALRVDQPIAFGAFIVAELPAVVAAGVLELGILFRRARSHGLPIVNLYSSGWSTALVAIPGIIVASLPLIAYRLLAANAATALGGMGLVALLALAACLPIVGRSPRGTAA